MATTTETVVSSLHVGSIYGIQSYNSDLVGYLGCQLIIIFNCFCSQYEVQGDAILCGRGTAPATLLK